MAYRVVVGMFFLRLNCEGILRMYNWHCYVPGTLGAAAEGGGRYAHRGWLATDGSSMALGVT